MSKLPISLLSIATLLLAGCALLEELEKPPLTFLEIQSLQTRDYNKSKEIVFSSVVSVFQNLGYTILSAHQATGLITAKASCNQDLASQLQPVLRQVEGVLERG